MKDIEIRKALHSYLKDINNLIKDTIIVDELDLCSGLARVDIAVINGSIHGYEIKSDEDTLNRLNNQIKYYNKSLEKITIVINSLHLENVEKLIPNWWGIIVIKQETEQLQIEKIKEPDYNPIIDTQSMLQYLWKDELQSLADRYEIQFKRNFSRDKIRNEISDNLAIDQIIYSVREALKTRKNWRSCSTTTVK